MLMHIKFSLSESTTYKYIIILCKNTGIFLAELNNNYVAQINYRHKLCAEI